MTGVVLGADVGGTKLLFGIEIDGQLTAERRYASADFPDFSSALARYLADTATDPHHITNGCLAIAGPVGDDGVTAKITNLPWTVDTAALAAHFGLPPLRLVNDFAAAAQGAVIADTAHRQTIQAGEPLAGSPRLVIGAGTGLGMAIVLPDANGWRIIPGEGGHVAFAPGNDEQIELLTFLQRRFGRVIWERVLSGSGLSAIHECLTGQVLRAEDISARALTEDPARYPAEHHTVELFLSAYGAFAGDMALATLSRGGVFLAGGIAGHLLPLMRGSGFLASFGAKAGHSAIAARMPVHVVTDPALGLRGAIRLVAAQ